MIPLRYFILTIITLSLANADTLETVFANLDGTHHKITPIDIDDDGDLDLLVSDLLYYQQGNGSFEGPFPYTPPLPFSYTTIGTGKITSDSPPQVFGLNIDRSVPSSPQYNLVNFPYIDYAKISKPTILKALPGSIYSYRGIDIDRDQSIDFLSQTRIENDQIQLSVFWGNSANSTEIATISEDEALPDDLYFIDINHDNLTDIVYDGYIGSNSGLCAILQTANRTFASPQLLTFSDNSEIPDESWQFADLDGNGMLDLYQTHWNSSTDTAELAYSLQTITGFAPPLYSKPEHSILQIIGVDHSLGKEAIVHYLGNSSPDQPITLYSFTYNNPEELLANEIETQLSPSQTLDREDNERPSLLVDINQDGQKDIILSLSWLGKQRITNYYTMKISRPQLCIGFGAPDGSFDFQWQGYSPQSQAIFVHSDFNDDTFTDIILGRTTSGDVELITNIAGDGWSRGRLLTELLPPSFREKNIQIHSITVIDINQDGSPDLNVHLGMPKPNIFTSNNTASVGNAGLATTDSAYTSEDFTYTYLIALNDGAGNFAYTSPLSSHFLNGVTNQKDTIFTYADWDNDGDLDAFTEAFGWYQNNNGSFSDSLHFLVSPGNSTDAIGNPITISTKATIVDIDGDGALDLLAPITGNSTVEYSISGAVSRRDTEITIIYGNGSGGFSEMVTYPISLLATDALGNAISLSYALLDLNQDGRLDLIFNQSISDALGNPFSVPHVLYNSADGRFRNLNPFSAANGFYGTIPADYNGDGIINLCGTNGFTSPSPYGPITSPEYDFFTPHFATTTINLKQLIDTDNDHDADFLLSPFYSKPRLYGLKNPLVNGDDPVVRYALDAGLMANQTLPDADAENDGHTNLVEYMFGGNPSIEDDSSILPILGTDLQSPQPKLTASFKQRRQLPAGKQYHLHISSDLQSWIDYPLEEGTTAPIDTTWQQFTISIDPSSLFPEGNKAFIQWDVK